MREIRVAVAGVGGAGGRAARDWAGRPGSKLVAVQDVDLDRVRGLSSELGCDGHESFSELVRRTDLDMVEIATPNHLHAPMALEAFDHGLHCLVQKPMTTMAADAEAMVERARQKGRLLGVYMSYLSDPLSHDLRDLVTAGGLGTIVSVRTRSARVAGYGMAEKGHWRAEAAKVGGGCFALIGVHRMNLAQFIVGSDVTDVTALSANILHAGHMEGDDMTIVLARLRNGAMATFEASYAATGGGMEIYGSEGRVNVSAEGVEIVPARAFRGRVLSCPTPSQRVFFSQEELERLREPHAEAFEQHRLFAQAVAEGGPAPVPGEIGLRDVRIIEAAYIGARERKWLRVGNGKGSGVRGEG